MKLKKLISKYNWIDIESFFIKNYTDCYDSLIGYKKAFEEIKQLTPSSKKQKMIILIDYITEELEEEDYYWYVYGKGKNSIETYAIEFEDWTDWLNMKIDESVFSKLTDEDILCHILWEMTFNGFSYEDNKQTSETLLKSFEETMENIKNGDCKLIPFDNLLKEIEEEIIEKK
jgi:hypothetical protein